MALYLNHKNHTPNIKIKTDMRGAEIHYSECE